LVEPSNIQMLAEKLTVLIQNPKHRATLGAAGAQKVRTSFDFKNCMTRVYPLFGLTPDTRDTRDTPDIDHVA
jgi:glycosyltransferase involved in cell wall biosynthesis